MYSKRVRSEGDIYHVFGRGTGCRVIFEDDDDRQEFCRRMSVLLGETRGEIFAWCLMGNHFHLIAHMPIEELARFMKRLNGGYARFFNERHGRVGHLFEGRFGSEPLKSDSQLLCAVRYVHRNPIKPGLSETCDYRIASTDGVLEIMGGIDQFVSFHDLDNCDAFLDVRDGAAPRRRRMTHDEAVALSKSLLGDEQFEGLPGLPKPQRDDCLRRLSDAGLPIRQIALVSGVGRGVVQRAVRGIRAKV